MGNYRKLEVWQRAHVLTVALYQATSSFPKQEQFGLVAQLRRSIASMPANIAEGCGRNSSADMPRLLRIAMGSANETDYWLLLARDHGYLDNPTADRMETDLTTIRRMLARLIHSLNAHHRQQPTANSQ
jgi:four helix bundle protein